MSQPTIHRILQREIDSSESISLPDRVARQGGGTYPARRPTVVPTKDARQAIAVAQRAKEAVPLAEQTIGKGAPGPGRGKKTGDNITRLSDRGTSADYLTRRIARDRPDILAKMQAGEFRSVRQAAIAAGIVVPRLSIPRDVAGAARALRRHFSPAEITELIRQLNTPQRS